MSPNLCYDYFGFLFYILCGNIFCGNKRAVIEGPKPRHGNRLKRGECQNEKRDGNRSRPCR